MLGPSHSSFKSGHVNPDTTLYETPPVLHKGPSVRRPFRYTDRPSLPEVTVGQDLSVKLK